ncbi:MAG TPA: hydantoinase/oxoprolinase family protein [Anaerolineae bacterium]|nr:hydantoinase/oxoprolinase family protein [Anaerolineae bacterium]
MQRTQYRIGIDVGGTFTDFLLLSADGSAALYKTLTTPPDPAIGLMNGLQEMADDHRVSLTDFVRDVELIVHGTTVATNAVLTGNGAPTGLLTTEGFRDAMQMRRGIREAQYDNHFQAPDPLVPRYRRLTAKGRVNYAGEEEAPLDIADVCAAAEMFRRENVAGIALCFMHAHANASHEQQAAEILRRELPNAYLSVSSELLPQIRFYDRTSTTVLNAYVGPLIQKYLTNLQARLQELNFQGILLIMQSNGGVASPDVTMRVAAGTLLSGPAAGPVAGLAFVEPHGRGDCITVDMGGTSFDAALIFNRQPLVVTDGRINGQLLALPMLDIHTIGAGGGSIGWIDSAGLLRMGPQSAGAEPGPACYGRGGDKPTCTDADLLLGYLSADYFLGGKLKLYLDRARTAIETHIAKPLNMSVEEAAAGMFSVINSNMADGIREVSVRRGYDPRDFPLVVAGGAGPIHAAVLALELEIPLLIVPRASSIFCAEGMLLSDLKHDFVRTCPSPLASLDAQRVTELCAAMETQARATLTQEHVPSNKQQLYFSADLRYIGQFHEVNVPLNESDWTQLDRDALAARFHARHDQLYGYSVPTTPIELVTLRLAAIGITDKLRLPTLPKQSASSEHALKGLRRAYLPHLRDFADVALYDGDALQHGNTVQGPALIEQATTTVFVPYEYDVMCDSLGSFALFLKERADDFVPMLDKSLVVSR